METRNTYHLINAKGETVESETKGSMGGHKGLKIYGRLDCQNANRWIAKGHYTKHRVFFADEATARAAGYRPCGCCMKREYRAWKSAA